MPQHLKRILALPAYPLLLAAFPVLYVYASNIGLTSFSALVPILILALLTTAAVWLLLNLVFKNKHKSGLMTSVVMLVVLTYGSYYAATDQLILWGLDLHKHRYTMLVSIIVLVLAWIAFKSITSDTAIKLGKIASVVAVLLLAMPLFSMASLIWQPKATAAHTAAFVEKNKVGSNPQITYPDVYYFVLDGYGRADVLQQRLGFDNAPFIDELKKRGFYVARQSKANYAQTMLSVTSSLNMHYLQDIYSPSEQPISYFQGLFRDNEVIRNFNGLGYTTINTASGYDFTNSLNTSITLTPAYSFSEFESTVYYNSIVPFLTENDLVQKFSRSTQIDFVKAFLLEQHRLKIRLSLEEPRQLPLKPGQPVMAFMHVLLAHQPFVFDANGNPLTPEGPFALALHNNFENDEAYRQSYIKSYREQVLYGNKELLKTIDAIQSNKDRKSVIILQGDHGPWSLPGFGEMKREDYKERMSILNAVYFPDSAAKAQLYEDISPVNTFRIIFNQYFNAGYTLEKDRSFFSRFENRFKFEDVTEALLADTLQNTAAK